MSDFLATMAASSRDRAAAVDRSVTTATAPHPVVPLQPGSFDIIAEIKDRSPAEGDLASSDIDRVGRAQQYAAAGAAAISVLTEPSRFAGSLAHLEEVVAAVPATPVMRKDFLVDPIQLYEARVSGASGALLIIAMLDAAQLAEMLDCAGSLGLFVLLEAFDEEDLGRAAALLGEPSNHARAAAGQLLVGVNTRDLRTLAVDNARLERLAPLLPEARCVAESGLHTAADAAAVAALGYRAALVGTALMRSDDPQGLVAAMRGAGSARIAA